MAFSEVKETYFVGEILSGEILYRGNFVVGKLFLGNCVGEILSGEILSWHQIQRRLQDNIPMCGNGDTIIHKLLVIFHNFGIKSMNWHVQTLGYCLETSLHVKICFLTSGKADNIRITIMLSWKMHLQHVILKKFNNKAKIEA